MTTKNTTAAPAAVKSRVFKTGGTEIPESEATLGKTPEQVRQILGAAYPEMKTATIRNTTDAQGREVIEFVAKEGRKG